MSLDFESTTDWAPTDWTAIGEDSLDEAITLRRAIHADPEVGLHCPRTSDKVTGRAFSRAVCGVPGQATTLHGPPPCTGRHPAQATTPAKAGAQLERSM